MRHMGVANDKTRQYLKYVDDELIRLWRLGRNAVVAWTSVDSGIEVLAVPQYLLPNLFENHEDILIGRPNGRGKNWRKWPTFAKSSLTELSYRNRFGIVGSATNRWSI